MSETFETVKAAITQVSTVDPARITPEAALVDDLGFDDLDRMEVGMELEVGHCIEIDDDDLYGAKTVADLVAAVDRRLAAKGQAA